MLGQVAVTVAVEVPRTVVDLVPRGNREVEQNDPLLPHLDFLVVADPLKTILDNLWLHLTIVVAEDEVLLTVHPVEKFSRLVPLVERDVSKPVHKVSLAHHGVIVVNDDLVVFLQSHLAKTRDPELARHHLVAEVKVTGEEYFVHGENIPHQRPAVKPYPL